MMAALYIAQWMTTAAALAAFAAAWPAVFGMRMLPRTILAASLTPHVLAVQVLALALVWPGAPRIVFLAIPALLSVVVLLALRAVLADIGRRLAHVVRVRLRNLRVLAAGACVLAIAAVLIPLVVINMSGPVTGNDIQVYLAEASVFAEHRTLESIPGFEVRPGEVAATHSHQFLWQAYLAQGLMATDGHIGFGHDAVARAALHLPFLLLGVMAIAVASVAMPAWTAALALPLLFLIDPMHLIVRGFSVDAFRILPFLAVAALLLTLIGRRTTAPRGRFVVIGAAAAFAVATHTINVVFLAILYLSLLLVWAIGQITFANLWRTAVVSGVMSSLTIAHYVAYWIRYGTPFGFGFTYFAYHGTPLWEAFEARGNWTRSEGMLAALAGAASRFGVAISATACISLLLSFGMAARHRYAVRSAVLGVMFATLLVVPLLPLGEGVSLQGALLSNSRYGLLIFALAAPLAASAAALALHAAGRRFPRKWVTGMAALVTFSIVAGAVYMILSWNMSSPQSRTEYLEKNELLVASLAEGLPEGAQWVTSRFTPTYTAERKPIYLYGMGGAPLLRAETESDALRLLDDMNVRMIAFYVSTRDWYPRTAIYRAVSSRDDVELVKSGYWEIYRLANDVSGWQ